MKYIKCLNRLKNNLKAVAVLGTGEPGSRPGRHFFVTHWGRQHEQINKKSSVSRSGFSSLISFHCVWNWKIGAPCSCRRPCLLKISTEALCCERSVREWGERRVRHFTSGSLSNGTDRAGVDGGSTLVI